jgi:hypothetical protein
MKICSRCNVEKSLDEFRKQRRYRNGINCWCRDCEREYSTEQARTETRQKSKKAWIEKNPEKVAGYLKKYEDKHNVAPAKWLRRRYNMTVE